MTSNKVKSVEDSVALRVLEDSINLRRFDDPELRDLPKLLQAIKSKALKASTPRPMRPKTSSA
eukprot:CAMPEP_0206593694 /NCGR_PEP_ID=MMETSP0325_2-20121206/41832_1 /ASSEMBLY_ACC=CAM_ASM_000347 /TAXON_ID=2866 /ORGANISM="Crypthecodinium cohnii, Strain Seligo" /LENGTH=62 /DNA_ID=CAMNT_0054103815 /DNA_START=1167 /DNA_END=1355 /DNA_ORIENTATION=+